MPRQGSLAARMRRPAWAALLCAAAVLWAHADEPELLFRFPAGGVVTTGPVVAEGRLWFISDSKTLYVITVDGTAIGKRDMSFRRAPFIAPDPFGRAALPVGSSSIVLLNKAGQEVWTVRLDGAPEGPPSFGPDGRMYAQSSQRLYAFAANGAALWSRDLDERVAAPLATGPGGGPLVGLADGSVRLFSRDGAPLWNDGFQSQPRFLATLGGMVVVALADGTVAVRAALEGVDSPEAQDPAAGTDERSDQRLGSSPLALAAGQDGFSILGSDGKVSAFSEDGSLAWSAASGLRGAAGIERFQGRTVVLSRHAVRSFGQDGALFRDLALTNATGLPAVSHSGTVFSGATDWILYAYRFERPFPYAGRQALPPMDREAAAMAARREAMWVPGGSTDDAVQRHLSDIEKSLKSGTIGEGAGDAALYAAAVALGMLDAPFGSGAVPQLPTPRGAPARIKACEVLGLFGSPEAVELLTEVFRKDPEPSVRAAAAQAVALIGLDPDGRALEAFADKAAGLDSRTALAVIAAVESLYRANGGLDDPSGALALLRIAGSGSASTEVRRMANDALRRVASRN